MLENSPKHKTEDIYQKPVMIDFYAPWCAPCKALAPTIDSLREEYGEKIDIYQLNTEEDPELLRAANIKAFPTIVLYNNGEEVSRLVGLKPKSEYEQKITEIAELEYNEDLKESLLKIVDLAIIGGGPAGLTAAIYGARENLNTLVITGEQKGGNITKNALVENYPGFPDGISGEELMDRIFKQAENLGAEILEDKVVDVDFSRDIKKLFTADDKEINAEKIIIATGTSPNKLGLENEEKFWGRGISTCSTCDGPLYEDKKVAVIEGGNSALEEALHLSKFAKRVYIINKNNTLKGQNVLLEKIKDNPKITLINDSEVNKIIGDEDLEAIQIKNSSETNDGTELQIDGIFLAIGGRPNTEFLKGAIDLDEKGYITIDENNQTSIEGIFAAGDVTNTDFKQFISASEQGGESIKKIIKT